MLAWHIAGLRRYDLNLLPKDINGTSRTLTFEMDNRFMQGTYVGVDGRRHQGTFGFI